MKRLRFVALAWIGLAATLAVPISASASSPTEAGNGCAGTFTESEGVIFFGHSNGAGSSLSATVPSAGVITGWTTNLGPFSIALPVPVEAQLQIYRGVGSQLAKLVGESDPVVLQTSTTSSVKTTGATRIPVLPGDLIADVGSARLSGEVKELEYYCPGQPSTVSIGAVEGPVSLGEETRIAGFKPERAVAATVQIEPDADGDGFGDITQDLATDDPILHAACRTAAAPSRAIPCPRPSLSPLSTRLLAGPRALRVAVTSDVAASAIVTGRVRAGGRLLTLAGRKRTRAGGTVMLSIPFGRALRRSLTELPESRSLKLRVLVTATGVEPARPMTVELHGLAGHPRGTTPPGS